jgi:hypothetical protein
MPDKWGRRLFTTGAVLLLVIGFIHSLSLLGKQAPANDTERQLLDLMSNYKFNVMGSMRSMDNFLRGFSISFMLGALALGAINLTLIRERAALLKRAAAINGIWLVAMTSVSLYYFFIIPTSCLVLTFLVFAAAWLKLRGEENLAAR